MDETVVTFKHILYVILYIKHPKYFHLVTGMLNSLALTGGSREISVVERCVQNVGRVCVNLYESSIDRVVEIFLGMMNY